MPNRNQGQGNIGRNGTKGLRRPHKPKPHKPKPHKPKRPNRLDDPNYVTRPRTLRDINRDANAATGLRYGEVDRAQAEQGRQIPVYYQNYLDQVSGIKTGVQAGYQKAIDDVTARQQATAASDTTARNSLGQQMQSDAASRGATVDPSLLAGDVNAANVRNTNQSAFANLLGAQQAAQGTYFAGQQQVGAASQLDSQRRLAADVKGTAADKGLYKSQYVTEGRDAERKYGLERSAFGLDVAQEQNKVATARAQRKATSRNARSQRNAKANEKNAWGYTNKEWNTFSPGKIQGIKKRLGPSGTGTKPKSAAGAKPKPLSKDGRDTTVTVRRGVAAVRKENDGSPGYWQASYNRLVEKNGLDPVVARAIVQGARHGRLGPKTKKGLRDTYGIEGFKFSKPKKRSKKKKAIDQAGAVIHQGI